MITFSEDLFEAVEARIINSGGGKVIVGEAGGGVWGQGNGLYPGHGREGI